MKAYHSDQTRKAAMEWFLGLIASEKVGAPNDHDNQCATTIIAALNAMQDAPEVDERLLILLRKVIERRAYHDRLIASGFKSGFCNGITLFDDEYAAIIPFALQAATNGIKIVGGEK